MRLGNTLFLRVVLFFADVDDLHGGGNLAGKSTFLAEKILVHSRRFVNTRLDTGSLRPRSMKLRSACLARRLDHLTVMDTDNNHFKGCIKE